MAESVKIATRESFGKALCELAKTHSDIVVLFLHRLGLQRDGS